MAFTNGKLYGQGIDTRKRLTRATGMEVVRLAPVLAGTFTEYAEDLWGDVIFRVELPLEIPAPDITFVRAVIGTRIKGGHNGKRHCPWDDFYEQRLPKPIEKRSVGYVSNPASKALPQVLLEEEEVAEPSQPMYVYSDTGYDRGYFPVPTRPRRRSGRRAPGFGARPSGQAAVL